MVPLHNILLLFRQRPRRFASQPLFWIVGFLAGNWGLAYKLVDIGPTLPLVPIWASRSIVVAGAALSLWSRLALGKRFGMLPADRGLVRSGPYRVIRHPFYVASFVMSGGYILSSYSRAGLALWAAGTLLNVWCAWLEERFMSLGGEYRAYARTVPYRFIPGLL